MFKQLSCEEFEVLLAENPDIIIADVRDIESYNEGHIGNAIHLSVPTLQDFCDSSDKQQPIMLYCYHGITSQSVAQHLVEQGFSQVYSLIGGYEMWKQRVKGANDHNG